MSTRSISGTYGHGTECEVFVYGNWYCVEGSANVNKAPCESILVDGVNVEEIEDVDYFEWKEDIDSEEMLEAAVDA